MAPIGQPVVADEMMEIESDFQDWTLELDAMNKQYGALQAAEDVTLQTTITAIENQIRADADGLIANLNAYMQQCLEKMRQEMATSVSRQVQQHLQLEKTKVEFEARRRQRSEAKKKQIVELFDKHHFPPSSHKKEKQLTLTGQNRPSPQPLTKASQLQSTLNGHTSKTSSPAPTTADSSLHGGSIRESVDGRNIAEASQSQSTGPADQSVSPTPGTAQSNLAISITSEPQTNSTAASVAPFWRVPSVDPNRVIESPGHGASKRKGETFTSGPADTVKRARVEQSRDEETTASAERQMPNSPQRRSSRSAAAQRTVSFAEVYQDGQAEHKHQILEYIEGSGKFYILKCEEHHVHFGSNPLAGAAKHLSSSQHHKLPKTHELAIEKLGYLVYDCTRELADKNNARFTEAIRKGYEPFNANRLTKAEKMARGIDITDSPNSHQETPTSKGKWSESVDGGPTSEKQFKGITDAKYGNLYLGYWPKDKTRYPVIVLPLGDLKAAGLQGTLLGTSLRKTVPKCYVVTRPTPDTKVISGWAKGYEDGGPLVTKREFPVMYFDKQFLVGWIAARHLSRFDFEDPNPEAYPEYFQARDYWARIQDDQCTNYDDWVKRGSIRNPTESPSPSNSGGASPVAGNENGTTEPTVSPAEVPRSTDASDGKLDQEMIDIGNVRADGSTEKSVAGQSRPDETVDVDMDLGNDRISRETSSQIAKAPEQQDVDNTSGASVKAATSGQTTGNWLSKDRSMQDKGATVASQNALPPPQYILKSSKPSESIPRPLSIPTPLNSTEVSPTTTGSPVITTPSSQGPAGNSTAQQFAARALHINTNHHLDSPMNPIKQSQSPNTNLSRGSMEPTRLDDANSRASQDMINIPRTRPNGVEQAARPVRPESIPMRSPPAETSLGRHQNPMQTYITTNSMSPVPHGVSADVSRMGSRGPTPTTIRETIESTQGVLSARNTASPQREPSTNGRYVHSSAMQSKSPIPNGGAGDRVQSYANVQLPPRPAVRSPVPTARPNFGSVSEQTRSAILAGSTSPSLGPYRSTSSTPTPAPEVTSRKGTPTIVRGDSLDRWKAVRQPSSFSSSPHSFFATPGSASESSRGPSASQSRPGYSLSSIMTASTPAYSPIKPESPATGKEQYFDVVGYRDSSDTKSYVKDDSSPYLRVTVNAARGVAETAAGEAIAVTINPKEVLKVIVKNIDQDKATVALTVKDPESRPEYWAFGTKNIDGRPVSGKIQARLFCKWIRSLNPNVQYLNTSATDSSRQSSGGRSPILD